MAFRKIRFLNERIYAAVQDPSLIWKEHQIGAAISNEAAYDSERIIILDTLLKAMVGPDVVVDHYTEGTVLMAVCKVAPNEDVPKKYSISMGFYDNAIDSNMTVNSYITRAREIDPSLNEGRATTNLLFELLAGNFTSLINRPKLPTAEDRAVESTEMEAAWNDFLNMVYVTVGDAITQRDNGVYRLNNDVSTFVFGIQLYLRQEIAEYDLTRVPFSEGVPADLPQRDLIELHCLLQEVASSINATRILVREYSRFTTGQTGVPSLYEKHLLENLQTLKTKLVRIEMLIEILNAFFEFANERYSLNLPLLVVHHPVPVQPE